MKQTFRGQRTVFGMVESRPLACLISILVIIALLGAALPASAEVPEETTDLISLPETPSDPSLLAPEFPAPDRTVTPEFIPPICTTPELTLSCEETKPMTPLVAADEIPAPDGGSPAATPIDPQPVPSGSGGPTSVTPVPPIPYPSSISGSVYDDADGSGTRQFPEAGLAGWTVHLFLPPAITPIASVTSDAAGNYRFANLDSGTYTLEETIAGADWTQTEGPHTVTLGTSYDLAPINFGNFKRSEISGFVWHDLNADGIWQQSGPYPEPALGAWGVHAEEQSGGVMVAASGTDGSYFFSFGPGDLGLWNLTLTSERRWEQTFPLQPPIHSASIPSGGISIPGTNFGVVRFFDVLGMKLAPISGVEDTPLALALDPTAILIPSPTGTHIVGIPGGLTFERTDGNRFDINALAAEDASSIPLSGFPAGTVVAGAIHWGLRGVELLMNIPIQVALRVSGVTDGTVLNILRSPVGTSGWTTDGIEPPATCVVLASTCFFGATKASNYVATYRTTPPAPPPPPPSGGGNGGSGGGGGGTGSGSVTTPIPPPPPPSQGGGTPAREPENPVTLASGAGGAPAEFAGTLSENPEPLITPEKIELNLPSPEGFNPSAETANDETPAPFLAGLLNVFSFGTGSRIIAWIILIALLIIIAFTWKRLRKTQA